MDTIYPVRAAVRHSLGDTLTGTNRNDVFHLLPLVEAIPPIRGKWGRPSPKPVVVQADRGYDHDKYRKPPHAAGVATQIARRGKPHGSGLGKTRWVVERTFAWLHNFKRLRIVFERLAIIHEAFMKRSLHHLLATASKRFLLALLSRLPSPTAPFDRMPPLRARRKRDAIRKLRRRGRRRPRYYLHTPIIGVLASQARHDSRPQSQS